jgi:hypothetical protein
MVSKKKHKKMFVGIFNAGFRSVSQWCRSGSVLLRYRSGTVYYSAPDVGPPLSFFGENLTQLLL